MSYERQRKAMVQIMKEHGIKDKNVLDAMLSIPRELFIDEALRHSAYENYPLPIGYDQTISQPYTIAFMLENLELKKGQNVLEIGTGSGYNAALIKKIIGDGGLVTTEYVPELAEKAEKILKVLKLDVKIIKGDGSIGYKDDALYDKIIVTCACPQIPPPITEQLKEEGIIIIPVGSRFSQEMVKGIKKNNRIITTSLGYFVFVPLKGRYGFD